MSLTRTTNPRVLQVHQFRNGSIRGGVDRVVNELLAGLGGSDAVLFEVGEWEDRGLTRRVEGDLTIYRRRLRLHAESLSLLRRGWEIFEVLLTLLQLAWLIKRENIDLVQLHTLKYYNWYFIWLNRLGICPYIITLHGTETVEYHNLAHVQGLRWDDVLQNAQKLVAVSSELARIATVNLPIRSAPEVVKNGINDPLNYTMIQGELLNMEAKPYAICVGALRYCKGHDIAIKAWSVLLKKGVVLELYIAGEGEERDNLERLCHELGCSEHVHFLGAVPHEQALSLVKSSDYYLMPSRHEGLPIALLEAAALERPIVATNLPAFCEIVDDGISAELFASEDHQALAEKIVVLSNDLNRRMALGSAARKKFLNNFTKETMILNYRDLYNRSIQGHHIVSSTSQWFTWNRGNKVEKTSK